MASMERISQTCRQEAGGDGGGRWVMENTELKPWYRLHLFKKILEDDDFAFKVAMKKHEYDPNEDVIDAYREAVAKRYKEEAEERK
jgi:hypothetical protein